MLNSGRTSTTHSRTHPRTIDRPPTLPADSYETMRAACARIIAGDSKGTGYLIDHNRIVTCAHIVKPVGVGGTVRVSFPGLSLDATVAKLDERSDAAVLNLAT